MSQQTLCAISYSAKRLGAALYDADEKEVKIIMDMAEDNDFVMLSRLLREIKPSNILVNRSQDAEFQMFLRRECNHLVSNLAEDDDEADQMDDDSCLTVPETPIITTQVQQTPNTITRVPETPNIRIPATPSMSSLTQTQTRLISSSRVSGFHSTSSSNRFDGESIDETKEKTALLDATIWHPSINILPDIAFSFGLAKKRLEHIFGNGMHNEHMLASFRFDFSSTNMIRSLGALFRFIEQQKAGTQNGKGDGATEFDVGSSIDKFSTYVLADSIEVDSTTIRALEIFYSDYIPESIRKKFVWGNNRAEGMSLFKLCNLCRSSPGKQMLRMWFERPTKDMKVLTERHEAIAYLYQDCYMETTKFLRNFMKDIASVKGIFRRMRRGNVPVNDWRNFMTTICTLVKIGQCLDEFEVNLDILKGKRGFLGESLQKVAALLLQVIDFQETLSENRLVVQKGIDEELDKRKELYEKLPDEMTMVAKKEAEDICIDGCSVAYVPIIGYLLMVPEELSTLSSTTLLELIFTSDGMSYFKTKRMRLLDENVGDIKMQIIDAETNILLNLQKRLLNSRQVVLQAVELAATLDCLISLYCSAVARNYNWVRPKFVAEPVLAIEQARHPIAELLCQTQRDYVQNPIFSSQELGKIKVIFGPNASGKSVYLKMVGIIVYMAHVGCFVPAQRAIIGPINRIMSRMYTVDSVLDGMSSFANDLKQITRAITRSDEHSLLIIDEFGKGTMTEVGLSLLASSLNYWLEGPLQSCPHVIVASHFYALPELLRDPQKLVRYQTMGVSRLDDESLEFHFNLMDGITDLSYANFTALRQGIPKEVIDRAEEVYIHLRAGGALSELGKLQN